MQCLVDNCEYLQLPPTSSCWRTKLSLVIPMWDNTSALSAGRQLYFFSLVLSDSWITLPLRRYHEVETPGLFWLRVSQRRSQCHMIGDRGVSKRLSPAQELASLTGNAHCTQSLFYFLTRWTPTTSVFCSHDNPTPLSRYGAFPSHCLHRRLPPREVRHPASSRCMYCTAFLNTQLIARTQRSGD